MDSRRRKDDARSFLSGYNAVRQGIENRRRRGAADKSGNVGQEAIVLHIPKKIKAEKMPAAARQDG